MKQTMIAMERLQVKLTTEKSKQCAQLIRAFKFDEKNPTYIPQEVIDAMSFFWNETSLPKGFEGLSKYSYILESAPYFFNSINRITANDYIPIQEDYLKARIKTIGVNTANFKMDNYDLTLIDVGGQRSERKKWFSCFDNVNVVIFCASLCDYDQFLSEDNGKSRILESLELFDFALNSSYFDNCAFALFMNKEDLFIEKIKSSPLESYFDDYRGGANLKEAKEFILQKYLSLNHSNRFIYHCFTTATDTKLMGTVFSIFQDDVLRKSFSYIMG